MFNSDALARIAVAVDLVNACRDDRLPGPSTPRPNQVFRAYGFRPPANRADWTAVAGIAGPLGDLLHLIARRDHDAAVDLLNRELRRRHVIPQLEAHDGRRWTLHFHPPAASFAEGWAAGISAALSIAYATGDWSRIGSCGSPDCARLFLDRGRNQQRRFCSLQCQNRAKSAGYRRRRSAT